MKHAFSPVPGGATPSTPYSPWPRRLVVIFMFALYMAFLNHLATESAKKQTWDVFGPVKNFRAAGLTVAGHGKGVENYAVGPQYRIGFINVVAPSKAFWKNGGDSSSSDSVVKELLGSAALDAIVVRCLGSKVFEEGKQQVRGGGSGGNVAANKGGKCTQEEEDRLREWFGFASSALGLKTLAAEGPQLVMFPSSTLSVAPGKKQVISTGMEHLQRILADSPAGSMMSSYPSTYEDIRSTALTFLNVHGGSVNQWLDLMFQPGSHYARARNKKNKGQHEDLAAVGEMNEGDVIDHDGDGAGHRKILKEKKNEEEKDERLDLEVKQGIRRQQIDAISPVYRQVQIVLGFHDHEVLEDSKTSPSSSSTDDMLHEFRRTFFKVSNSPSTIFSPLVGVTASVQLPKVFSNSATSSSFLQEEDDSSHPKYGGSLFGQSFQMPSGAFVLEAGPVASGHGEGEESKERKDILLARTRQSLMKNKNSFLLVLDLSPSTDQVTRVREF